MAIIWKTLLAKNFVLRAPRNGAGGQRVASQALNAFASWAYTLEIKLIREGRMAVVAKKPTLKTFHATIHVTRMEEWCVEAETPEEAQALLASGQGYRCHIGDCLHFEVDHVES